MVFMVLLLMFISVLSHVIDDEAMSCGVYSFDQSIKYFQLRYLFTDAIFDVV